jgi:hypothetical protein
MVEKEKVISIDLNNYLKSYEVVKGNIILLWWVYEIEDYSKTSKNILIT